MFLVTGGKQGRGKKKIFLDSTEILESNTWRVSAPLPTARIGSQAVTVANTIYLFGRIFVANSNSSNSCSLSLSHSVTSCDIIYKMELGDLLNCTFD